MLPRSEGVVPARAPRLSDAGGARALSNPMGEWDRTPGDSGDVEMGAANGALYGVRKMEAMFASSLACAACPLQQLTFHKLQHGHDIQPVLSGSCRRSGTRLIV